jgi:hypothetical protein
LNEDILTRDQRDVQPGIAAADETATPDPVAARRANGHDAPVTGDTVKDPRLDALELIRKCTRKDDHGERFWSGETSYQGVKR